MLLLLLFANSSIAQSANSEEESIYSLVLKAVGDSHTTFFTNSTDIVPLLIIKETMLADSISPQTGEKEPSSQKGLRSNFVRVNQKPIVLTQQFSLDQRFRLVSTVEINDLIAESKKIYERERVREEERHFERTGQKVTTSRGCDGLWSLFDKRFPDDSGYFRLSRIGYSNNRRFALVEVDGLGACWNSNHSIYLKKTRSGWKIYTIGAGFGIA